LHDISAADDADVLVSIAFNGWVNVKDEIGSTQKRVCILSVETSKAAINQEVSGTTDPRAQFKSLRGTAGENLSELAPVAPARLPKGAQVWTMAAHDDVESQHDLRAQLPAPPSISAGSRG
jgi:hypothetical protein